MARSTTMLLVALALPALVGGCQDDAAEGDPGPILADEDLIGRWAQIGEFEAHTLDFRADGTVVDGYDDGADSWSDRGTWRLDAGLLTLHFEGEEEGDGWQAAWLEAFTTYPAIVDGRLYLDVALRLAGSGGGPDGSWEIDETYLWEYTESGGPDGPYEESEDYWGRLTAAIDGGAVEYGVAYSDISIVNGEEDEDLGSLDGSGTVRADADRIYFTLSEIDGEAVASGDQEEWFLGWQLSRHAMDMYTDDDADPAASSYERF